MELTPIEEDLIAAYRASQRETAIDYVKKSTSFLISESADGKLHFYLVETATKEVIKKVNLTKLFMLSKSDKLIDFFRAQIESKQPA